MVPSRSKIKKKVFKTHRLHALTVTSAFAWPTHSTIEAKNRIVMKTKTVHSVEPTMTRLEKTMITNCFGWMWSKKKFNSIPLIVSIVTRYLRCFLLLAHIINYYPIRTQTVCSHFFLFRLYKSTAGTAKHQCHMNRVREKDGKRLNLRRHLNWAALWSVRVYCPFDPKKSKQNINNPVHGYEYRKTKSMTTTVLHGQQMIKI